MSKKQYSLVGLLIKIGILGKKMCSFTSVQFKTDTLVRGTEHTSCDCLGVLNWSFSVILS